jgi:hypothetical protein
MLSLHQSGHNDIAIFSFWDMYRIGMYTGNLGIDVPALSGIYPFKLSIKHGFTQFRNIMYPNNFHDNSLYAPKPTPPGAIQNEHSSRFRSTRTPVASIMGSPKIQHMPKRETVWPFHLETALLEGQIFNTIECE